jgi:CHRD domain
MQKQELLVVVAAALVAGCTSDKPAPTSYEIRAPLYAMPPHAGQSDFNFNTHLTGDEETPPNASPAQGQAVLRVSDDGASVDFQLIASNIDNITQAHIHCGPPGVAGPIRIWLFPVIGTSGTALPPGGGRHDGVLASGTFHPAGVTCPAVAGNPSMPVLDAGPGVPPGPGNFPAGEIRGQLDRPGNHP